MGCIFKKLFVMFASIGSAKISEWEKICEGSSSAEKKNTDHLK